MPPIQVLSPVNREAAAAQQLFILGHVYTGAQNVPVSQRSASWPEVWFTPANGRLVEPVLALWLSGQLLSSSEMSSTLSVVVKWDYVEPDHIWPVLVSIPVGACNPITKPLLPCLIIR
ncbi:hypothetical protein EYF80_018230 [Liparis tanakae]|uniref:Uncharacterized protein n=1 Tax=Liparis tanakae TaxID=230148 RepID=A0A4Z2I2K6_9TELE|nr:hypothetical protein EYF80_018230 [Liparis tanakae]